VARIVLDSSVVIALLMDTDQHHGAAFDATLKQHQYVISAITLSEALISPFRTSRKAGERVRHVIESSMHQIIDIDMDIAILAAQIRADKNLKMPDALISATATNTKARLWTCDRALAKAHEGSLLIA